MPFMIPMEALRPFYDTPAAFSCRRAGGRTLRGSCLVCVFPAGFDDPLSSASAQSERATVDICVMRRGENGWFDQTPPRKGDSVEVGGRKYEIMSVYELFADEYAIQAREVR